MANLYQDIVTDRQEEWISVLLDTPGTRIERIVSQGQASAPGFWYQQQQAEWVLLLQGGASLRFEDEEQSQTLRPGDYVLIAPQRRHRVEHTLLNTIWLAVWLG